MLSPIKAIGDLVTSIVEGVGYIVDFFKGLLDWVLDLLKKVFVPSDDYWSEKTGMLQHTLESKFGKEGYEQVFNTLQNADSSELDNITIDYMGNTITVVDFSYLRSNISAIHTVIYAIFGVLLVRYNLNNFYKAVRGEDLYKGGDST